VASAATHPRKGQHVCAPALEALRSVPGTAIICGAHARMVHSSAHMVQALGKVNGCTVGGLELGMLGHHLFSRF
jgi:hypothetical protein